MNTKITVKDIIDITMGKLIYGDENEICENFSRNTKEINQDDIFVGLKGDKFEGGSTKTYGIKDGGVDIVTSKLPSDIKDAVEKAKEQIKNGELKPTDGLSK